MAEDLAGNRSATPTGPGIAQTVYDTISPEVLSIDRLDATPTNAPSVRFAVSFSDRSGGLDATDFVLSASGLSGAAVSGVSGGPADYTVTVNTGSGDGTLGLDLPGGAGTGIQDLAGNALSSGFGGQSYRVDRLFPSFGTPVVFAFAGSAGRQREHQLHGHRGADDQPDGDGRRRFRAGPVP